MADKSKARHYVDNKLFTQSLIEYHGKATVAKAAGQELPRVPEYVGECIILICTNLAHKYNFANYSFRDEMTGDAIENCLQAVNSFDPTKPTKTGPPNAFGYFTLIAYRAFVRRIAKEKKQSYIKHKGLLDQTMAMELMQELSTDSRAMAGSQSKTAAEFYATSSRIVSEFEAKETEKKTKKSKEPSGIEKFTE